MKKTKRRVLIQCAVLLLMILALIAIITSLLSSADPYAFYDYSNLAIVLVFLHILRVCTPILAVVILVSIARLKVIDPPEDEQNPPD